MNDILSSVLEAIEKSDIATLKDFISSGKFCVNDIVDESTMLGLATESRNVEVVQLFIEYGADVNLDSDNPDVTTALMDAVYSENLDVVRTLINAGADPNIIRDGNNFALKIASGISNQKIFEYLEQLTSLELRQKLNSHLTPDFSIGQSDNLTDLFFNSVRQTDVRKIKQAITSGVNVNTFDTDGNTALMYAAQKGKFDTVKMLLAAGADPNPLSFGLPPLMAAVGIGDVSIVKILIEAGSDVNASVQGRTVLMQAETYFTYFNQKIGKEIIDILIKSGAQ